MLQIKIGDYAIDVVRKDIKNLHLAVYPHSGRIRLSAPLHVDDETIRLHLESKLSWINKHLSRFQEVKPLPLCEYSTGESHYLEGRRYLLNVITNSSINMIRLRNDTHIDLFIRKDTPAWHRPKMLQEWYRARLKIRIEPLLSKWQEIIGVQVNEWNIKQMKTRWGTCNTKAKRIWINLELAKKTEDCLEYIIVHELLHLLERKHNEVFRAYMDKYLPDWKNRKDVLNRFPHSADAGE